MSASLSTEFAGLGGDMKFLKTRAKFAYFYGLEDKIDYDLILRYKMKANYIINNGYLPIGEKAYMVLQTQFLQKIVLVIYWVEK